MPGSCYDEFGSRLDPNGLMCGHSFGFLRGDMLTLLLGNSPPIKFARKKSDRAQQNIDVIGAGHIVFARENHPDSETDQ
jgi:hypothetical protein